MHCIRHLFYTWCKCCRLCSILDLKMPIILINSIFKQSKYHLNREITQAQITTHGNVHTKLYSHIVTQWDTHTHTYISCIFSLLFWHLCWHLCDCFLRSPSCRRKAPDHWILDGLVSCVFLTILLMELLFKNNSTENLSPFSAHFSFHLDFSTPKPPSFFLSSCFAISILSSFFPITSFINVWSFFPPFFLVVPQPGRHRRPMTAPKTQKDKASKRKKVLLTVLTVIVLLGILVTAGYFSESQFKQFSSKKTCKICIRIQFHSLHIRSFKQNVILIWLCSARLFQTVTPSSSS